MNELTILKRIFWLYYDRLQANMPDDEYLKKHFRRKVGYELNLDNPRSFNEKLQWLKIHDHNLDYIEWCDKVLAKEKASKIMGEEHIVPTLKIYNDVKEINLDELPNQFVLKTNHDSGGVVVCKDKDSFDIDKARKYLNVCIQRDYYLAAREWPYRNIERHIFAEQYIEETGDGDIVDYKLMIFNGQFRCAFTCTERHLGQLKVTFFDKNWNVLPFERKYPKSLIEIKRPNDLSDMVQYAEMIAKDWPFARIDFYECNGNLYFGEVTYYPGGGWEPFNPIEWDYKLGEWIDLEGIKKIND